MNELADALEEQLVEYEQACANQRGQDGFRFGDFHIFECVITNRSHQPTHEQYPCDLMVRAKPDDDGDMRTSFVDNETKASRLLVRHAKTKQWWITNHYTIDDGRYPDDGPYDKLWTAMVALRMQTTMTRIDG